MTLVFTGVITSWGTAFLSRSAIGLGVWPGNAVSTRPAWSAAVAVVRVLHVLDELALAPLFQPEGPGPDATRAIAGRRAVVPPRSRPQEEDQAAVVVLPRPPLRQFADDRVHPVRGLERIEEHQVAEAGHGWPHGGDRGSFVYCEPLRQVLAQPQS